METSKLTEKRIKEYLAEGKRFDGRKLDETRIMEAKVGVVPNADGSALFSFGDTIAIAAVYGPKRCIPNTSRTQKKEH